MADTPNPMTPERLAEIRALTSKRRRLAERVEAANASGDGRTATRLNDTLTEIDERLLALTPALLAEVDRLRALFLEAATLLALREWSDGRGGALLACPACGAWREFTGREPEHLAGCRVRALLDAAEKEGGDTR